MNRALLWAHIRSVLFEKKNEGSDLTELFFVLCSKIKKSKKLKQKAYN